MVYRHTCNQSTRKFKQILIKQTTPKQERNNMTSDRTLGTRRATISEQPASSVVRAGRDLLEGRQRSLSIHQSSVWMLVEAYERYSTFVNVVGPCGRAH